MVTYALLRIEGKGLRLKAPFESVGSARTIWVRELNIPKMARREYYKVVVDALSELRREKGGRLARAKVTVHMAVSLGFRPLVIPAPLIEKLYEKRALLEICHE